MPCAASTIGSSGLASATAGGSGSRFQRSQFAPNHASHTITRSCATTAIRGWMTATSWRMSVAAGEPAFGDEPDREPEGVHDRGDDPRVYGPREAEERNGRDRGRRD